MKRKLTREEADMLDLQHYAEHYEFDSEGTCVSLRTGKSVVNTNGTVYLSGTKHSKTISLAKVIAVMYMNARDFSKIRLKYDIADGRVINVHTELKTEYFEQLKERNREMRGSEADLYFNSRLMRNKKRGTTAYELFQN